MGREGELVKGFYICSVCVCVCVCVCETLLPS